MNAPHARHPAGAAPVAAARMVLADGDALSRAGVRRVLVAAGFEVCAETADAETALRACLAEAPDLCLLDMGLAGDALALTERLGEALPRTRVVILTLSERGDDLLAALEAGAVGYLLKDMAAERLGHALADVLAGETAVPRRLVTALADEVRRRRRHALGDVAGLGLSPREQEVLQALADGLSTTQIGAQLSISPVTVRRHVSTLVGKLGVPDRAAAARYVIERRANGS